MTEPGEALRAICLTFLVAFAPIAGVTTIPAAAAAANTGGGAAPTFDHGSSTTLTVYKDSSNNDIGSLLSATDSDGGDTLTWTVSSSPNHGSLGGFSTSESAGLSVSPSGLTYTPDPGYTGTDSFDIQVADGNGGTDTITINVNLNPSVFDFENGVSGFDTGDGQVEDQESAGTLRVTAAVFNIKKASSVGGVINGTESARAGVENNHESKLTFELVGDKQFDLRQFTLRDASTVGEDLTLEAGGNTASISLGASATQTYDISAESYASDFQGITSFTLESDDGMMNISVDDIVLENIHPVNHAPTFDNGDSTTLTVEKDSSNNDVDSLLAATDSDGSDTLTWSETVAPGSGSTSGFPDSASAGTGVTPSGITYTPPSGTTGTNVDSFDVQVSDGTVSDTITVNVNVGSSGPTADLTARSDQTIFEGSWVTLDASNSNDDTGIVSYEWDFDGDGTTDQTTSNPVVNHTYWETGTHTATLTVRDGEDNTDTDTVTVTVNEAMAKYHGGPRNLGHYPNQTGPASEPVEQWNISDGTPHVMQSTIVNGTLYTAFHDGGNLYALDPETGAVEWSATPGGTSGSTWTTPAYANGVLYIGTNDYKLHAMDAENGNELWNYSTQQNVRSAPTVVDDVVYFGSNDGNMTAVNATTGEELWHHTLSWNIPRVESNPAVVDGMVYFGSHGNNVTALNATTGNRIWQFSTDGDPVGSDPTVVNDTVYIGSGYAGPSPGPGTHEVYALNATDGTERWNHTLTGQIDSGQAYADGTLYAASRGGNLTALNASDGSVVWNVTGNDFRGAPVVVNGVVYIMDIGNTSVHAFNATDGTELWAYDSPTSSLYASPLVWNDILYYGSGTTFYALAEPAPSITNVNVTNPSARNLEISFDSSLQLSTISVSISGAESTTLTESDFTETANGDGSYTYTASYSGSTNGDYTATVDTAIGPDGKDGASGESDSASVSITQITDWNDLDNVRNDLDNDYVLAADLDKNSAGYSSIASGSANGGSGFAPLGDDTTSFTGSFDGNGYTISNLTISRPSTDYVGLFGYTGSGATVSNVTLADADVVGNNWVGALVGNHTGSDIRNVSAGGTITGRDYVGGAVGQIRNANVADSSASGQVTGTAEFVGGLVGRLETGGSIQQSHATSTVVANGTGNTQNHVDQIGGLVGHFSGDAITNSSAAGNVTATSSKVNEIGGLAGLYDGSGDITNSSASGNVSSEYKETGGLVGEVDSGSIIDSSATGTVTADGDDVGGLVGEFDGGEIDNASATGDVHSPAGGIGGLVGDHDPAGHLTDSYATGDVNGSSYTGGLVGTMRAGNVTDSYATGDISGDGDHSIGGLIGWNIDGDYVVDSYATGNVTASTTDGMVGGLIGQHDGADVIRSNASGAVDGTDSVGGLIGDTDAGSVIHSNATGSVTGDEYVGGLLGTVRSGSGNVSSSNATGSINGNNRVGGLVGRFRGDYIKNSYATGSVDDTGTSEYNFGGLVGRFSNGGHITDSYATGSVYNTGRNTGGLVGYLKDSGEVTNSSATGNVTGEDANVGGLIGLNAGSGEVANSSATGNVTGNSDQVGGLIGRHEGTTVTTSSATGIVSGSDSVGGLVGYSTSTVTGSNATGSVNGINEIGGLVGYSTSTVTESIATGSINGTSKVGGLVGHNDEGTVTESTATGSVNGTSIVGGLVGSNAGTATDSNATGDVSGSDNVGGFAGSNIDSINKSFAAGNVSISNNIGGGLVGSNGWGGHVTESYATGTVSGSATKVGGLIGENGVHPSATSGATVTNSYATSNVSGSDNVGGLVGVTFSDVYNSSATGTVSGSDNVGGLVGSVDGGYVNESNSTGTVSGSDNVGGLVGTSSGTVNKSYTTGTVTGNVSVGGFVGYTASGAIDRSYMTGAVTGNQSVGGFVGNVTDTSTVNRSYAAGTVTGNDSVGGFAGVNDGTVSDAYWDTQTTGQSSSAGGTGLPTAKLAGDPAKTNTSLDFTSTWSVVDNSTYLSYPYLQANSQTPAPAATRAVSISNVSATNPSGQNVSVALEAGGQLQSLSVNLSGAESATLSLADFTESGSGPYTYTATYEGSSGGDYTATVESAVGPNSRDGASGESDTVTVSLYEIGDWYDLNATRGDLDGTYDLVSDLDRNSAGYSDVASPSANNDSGFVPIDAQSSNFTGTFDGNGHTIADLHINRSSESDVGLFGIVATDGTVRNVTLDNVTTTGKKAVGGLVGWNHGGNVTNVSVSGTVTGYRAVGGLAGLTSHGGTIRATSATGTVTGINSGDDGVLAVGGLVGTSGVPELGTTRGPFPGSTIVASNASATVTVANASMAVGGLIGVNNGTIRETHATGTVTVPNVTTAGTPPGIAGGLVGANLGTVANSSATGSVTGPYFVGGLVGGEAGEVIDSSATGNVTGTQYVGGLVGFTLDESVVPQLSGYVGSIRGSTASGAVTGNESVGGLVGVNGIQSFFGQSQLLPGDVIENSTASGTVTLRDRATAGSKLGGLAGESTGTITTSNATGDVDTNGSATSVGGLVGYADTTGTTGQIDTAYATGAVNGSTDIGGLVGTNVDTLVTQTYATGSVGGDKTVGGLIGNVTGTDVTVNNSYAVGSVSGTSTVGGLVGTTDSDPTVTDAYWDINTTGKNSSAGNGTGLTTVALSGDPARTNTSFDFTSTWSVVDNSTYLSYPYLQANTQTPAPAATLPVSISNVSATNPSGQNVEISFDVDQQLQSLSVNISGAENATLSLSKFTESGSGPYTYTATYEGSSDGSYTATLTEAKDGAGNDAAVSHSDSVSISTSSPQPSPDPADFGVTIDSAPGSVTAGNTVTVEATVTNTGDRAGTQDITFSVNGTTAATRSNIDLNGGSSEPLSFSYATDSTDIGELDIEVASDDDTATDTVTVSEPPESSFTITDLTAPEKVTAGETLTVETTIENTGDADAQQQITLSQNELVTNTTTLSLAAGANETVAFTLTTQATDIGKLDIGVASDDDTATTTTTVVGEASITLDIDAAATTGSVVAGETATVVTTIANTGTIGTEESLTLNVNGNQTATKSVSVGDGQIETVSFDIQTTVDDTDNLNVTITGSEQTATTTIAVAEPGQPFVDVSITDSPDTIVTSETAFVTVEIENTGQVVADQTVAFDILNASTDVSQSEAVSLTPKESTITAFSWEPTAADTGTHTATVASNDTTASANISVVPLEASSLEITLDETDVFVDQSTTATARATFTNGSTETVTGSATLSSADQSVATISDDGTVTAVGGGTTTINVSFEGLTATTTLTVTDAAPVAQSGVVTDDRPDLLEVTFDRPIQLNISSPNTAGLTVETDGQPVPLDNAVASDEELIITLTEEVPANASVAVSYDGTSDNIENAAIAGVEATAFTGFNVTNNVEFKPVEATIGASSYSVSPNTSVGLKAIDSTVPEAQQASYEWRVDGTVIAETDEPQTITRLNATGSTTAAVTIDAGTAGSDTDQTTIRVRDTTSPMARLSATEVINSSEAPNFDATASTDNFGIASYEWDFGDGTTTAGESLTTPDHTYSTPGRYDVRVTVTDTSGNTATNTTTVFVEDPAAVVETDSLVFGSVGISSSSSNAVTVRNTGTAELTITDAILNGSDSGSYTSEATADGSVTIRPGDRHSLPVKFSPTSVGEKSGAALQLETNNPDSTRFTVDLSGSGIESNLTSVGSAADFDSVEIGAQATTDAGFENIGAVETTITNASITGSDQFSVDTTSLPLPVTDTTALPVTFSPTGDGEMTGTLSVTTSDGSTASLPLSGSGVGADMYLASSQLAFTDTPLNAETTSNIQVENYGSAALDLTDVRITGAGADQFSVTDTPQPIAPNTAGEIGVSFTPTEGGTHQATLVIDSNDHDEPTRELTVTGEGLGPEIDINKDTLNFPPATLTLTVTNQEGSPTDLRVDDTPITGKHPQDFTIISGAGPFTLAPGESETITVQFNRTGSGGREAQLKMFSNAENQPFASVWLTNADSYILLEEVSNPTIGIEGMNLQRGDTHVLDASTPATIDEPMTITDVDLGVADNAGFEMQAEYTRSLDPVTSQGFAAQTVGTASVGTQSTENLDLGPNREVVQHIDFDTQNVPSGLFASQSIEFTINRSQLTNGTTPDELQLYALDGGDWDTADQMSVVSESASTYTYATPLSNFTELTLTGPSSRVESLEFSVGKTELQPQEETTATVTATFTDGSEETVTTDASLKSFSQDIATVDAATVTGLATGTAELSAQYTAGGTTVSDTATVTVIDQEDPFFDIVTVGAEASSAQANGSVNATVKNIGGSPTEQTVSLVANGSSVDTTTVTLAPNGSQSLTLTWPASELTSGPNTAVIQTADTSETVTIKIEGDEEASTGGGGGGGGTSSPARFGISETSVTGTQLTAGDTLDVIATIRNTGGTAGFYTARLKLNGTQIASDRVAVGSGSQTTVKFTPTIDTPGVYRVTVGDQVVETVRISAVTENTGNTPQPDDSTSGDSSDGAGDSAADPSAEAGQGDGLDAGSNADSMDAADATQTSGGADSAGSDESGGSALNASLIAFLLAGVLILFLVLWRRRNEDKQS